MEGIRWALRSHNNLLVIQSIMYESRRTQFHLKDHTNSQKFCSMSNTPTFRTNLSAFTQIFLLATNNSRVEYFVIKLERIRFKKFWNPFRINFHQSWNKIMFFFLWNFRINIWIKSVKHINETLSKLMHLEIHLSRLLHLIFVYNSPKILQFIWDTWYV